MIIAGIPCTMPAIWIGLIVIFLIVEGLTAGLVTIWFAVGALAALIAAMFHAPLWLQLVWFFAVSIAAPPPMATEPTWICFVCVLFISTPISPRWPKP